MIQPSPSDPQILLAHTQSLRAIARSLLRNEADVEDVLQETWLAALRAKPDDGRPLGGWLATVTRNLSLMRLRSRRRQAKHEPQARRPAEPDAPTEVAQRFETARLLAEAVAALDDPYRETVLLRYFENLTPAEIAHRTGVPAGTVRSRLKRALEQLRARFGDRRNALLALAAFAGGAEAGATALWTKLLVAGAAAGIAATLFVALGSTTDEAPRQQRAGTRVASGPLSARTGDDEQPTLPTAPVRGRAFGPSGEPIAGATIHFVHAGEILASTQSVDGGAFAFDTPLLDRFELIAKASGCGWSRTRAYGRLGIEVDLRSAPPATGSVIDLEGNPVAGARVELVGVPPAAVTTDQQGRYSVEASRSAPLIRVSHPGYMTRIGRPGGRFVLDPGTELTGVLLTADGSRGIPGATVRFYGAERTTATTDRTGRFRLLHGMRDRYQTYYLRVDAGQHGTLFFPDVPWTPSHDLRIRTKPVRVVTGRVLHRDTKQPVAGLRVWANPTNEIAHSFPMEAGSYAADTTDEDGRFRLEGIPRQRVTIDFRHPELCARWSPVATVQPGANDADFEILVGPHPFAHLRVVGPDGQPVGGAGVRIFVSKQIPGDALGRHNPYGARTGPDGCARIRLHRYSWKVQWVFVAIHPDYEPVRVDATGEQPQTIRLTTPATPYAITGTVTDPEGRPIPGATIGNELRASENGTFVIRRPPARSLVVAGADGFRPTVMRDVPPGANLRIVLRPLPPVIRFRGRIVDRRGDPVAGADLAFPRQGGCRTQEDGTFSIKFPKPGSYPIRFPDHLRTDVATIDAPSHGTVEIVVTREPMPKRVLPARLTIEGRVLDHAGRPFPLGTKLEVRARHESGGGFDATVRVDLDGRFLIEHVQAGRYVLRMRQHLGRVFEPLSNVEAGTRDIVWQPVETGAITGRVFAPDGSPVVNVKLTAVPLTKLDPDGLPRSARDYPGWDGRGAYSDESGAFRIETLPRDRYVLVAYHQQHAPTLVRDLDWKSTNVRVDLLPGQTLRGRVLDAEGHPCKAEVTARDRWGFARTLFAPDGSFAIPGLADGDCEISATNRTLHSRMLRVPTSKRDVELRLTGSPPRTK